MRIGIDAHTLGSNSAGNESYCMQLLQGLASETQTLDDRYIVYFTRRQALSLAPNPSHFTLKRIRPVNPFVRIPISFPLEFQLEKLDVFHAQYIIPPCCPSRTVVSIHDVIFERYPEFFSPLETFRSKMLIPWSARRADHIITLSEFSKTDIVRCYGIAPDKISVIYEAPSPEFRVMGRDEAKSRIEQRYQISGPFILYVGRIQARKNILRLVEAFASLARQGIASQLVIVGGQDWQAEEVTRRIESLQLNENVLLTGYIDQADLPAFYNAADLFVFPSICEGFGIPVLEAMACGIPVVTSLGSSLEEVARNAAVLVDPLSTESIADGMGRVLTDANLRQSLREKGLQRASQFSGRRKTLDTLSVYRNLASRN